MAFLSLLAKLGLDKTGFDAGMNSASKQTQKFGADLKSAIAGAFTVAAVTQFTTALAGAVGRIKDLAEQTGLSTEEVQKADAALKQSGMAFEDLVGVMSRLTQSRRDAVEGNDDLRESFAKFGLTVQDLNNPQLRTFDLLMKISGAMKAGAVAADQQGFLMDLLGNKAGKLANVLQSLSEMPPVAIFTDETIQKIDDATKAIERFKMAAMVEVGETISLFQNLFDDLGGQMDAQAHAAAQPVFPLEVERANAAKRARIAAEDARQQAGLWKAGAKDKDKPAPGLFDIVNQALEFVGRAPVRQAQVTAVPGIQSDQFQRVGAFTSGGPQAQQTAAITRMENELREIKQLMANRGILVRGTD